MISLATHRAIESEGALTPAQASTTGTLFADLPTEHLRLMASKTDGGHASWHQWSREMLLAFFHNRHGKYVPGISENT